MSVVVANLSGFDDYFALFQIKPQFKIDRQALESAYLTVQKQVHPDLHAGGSEAEKRVSMQMATLANSAYRTLMNPIQRGLYLCAKNGVDPQLETNTAMPATFLMQQMEWRETLDEARDNASKLEELYAQVEKTKKEVLLEVEQAIDGQQNFEVAAQKLRALLFIDKFSVELEEAISA
jgi:molecular chaperone HscB